MPLSHAVTCAFFGPLVLIALIRSPTVSVPVDAKFVVLVPSLTVMVPFGGIPRVNSDVLAVRGTVPVPVAGDPEAEEGALEPLDDDDVEPACEACTAPCNAAVSWALTRANAVLFAMPARPCASLATALPMPVMSAVLNAWVWFSV